MTAFEVDCNDGKGEPMACHNVGEFFSVVQDEHARAAKVYKDNCPNYAPSCFNLARLHLAGRGVPQDDAEADRLFDKACKSGKHMAACYHQGVLSFLSADGKGKSGAPRDDKKQQQALTLLEKTCRQGEMDSCYFVGSHLLNPALEPGRRDAAKALDLLKRACEGNHAPSCYNLAVLFKNGDVGVEKSEEQYKNYKVRTEELVARYGGLKGRKTA